MNPLVYPESPQADELRRAFDQTFAAPAVPEAADSVSLIAIRLGGDTFALRMDQVNGIAQSRPIVPASSRIPEFMGIAGMRGALVPVFDLAALVGLKPSEAPPWFAIVHRQTPLALAFDALDGQIEVRRTSLYEEAHPARRYVRQLVQIKQHVHAVIDVSSVVEAIHKIAELSRS